MLTLLGPCCSVDISRTKPVVRHTEWIAVVVAPWQSMPEPTAVCPLSRLWESEAPAELHEAPTGMPVSWKSGSAGASFSDFATVVDAFSAHTSRGSYAISWAP